MSSPNTIELASNPIHRNIEDSSSMKSGAGESHDNDNEEWRNQVLNSMKSNGNEFPSKSEDSSLGVRLAVNASWAVNWFLLGAKLFAVIASSSKAVTAALADSFVDLASQAVLSLAQRYIAKHSPNYPVGRSRLEALSVIGCAFIMCMASIEGKRTGVPSQCQSLKYLLLKFSSNPVLVH